MGILLTKFYQSAQIAKCRVCHSWFKKVLKPSLFILILFGKTSAAADLGHLTVDPEFIPGLIEGTLSLNAIDKLPASQLPQNLLEMTSVNLEEASEIVLVSFNPNLGDNIILDYSRIEYLHQKYPKAVIKVVSPTSSILKESDWLKTASLPYLEFLEPEFAQRFVTNPSELSNAVLSKLLPHIRPGSVVLWDAYTLDVRLNFEVAYALEKHLPVKEFQKLNYNGLRASGIPTFTTGVGGAILSDEMDKIRGALVSEIKKSDAAGVGYSFLGGKETVTVVPKQNARPSIFSKAPGELFEFRFLGPIWNSEVTLYNTSASVHELFFGKDFYLAWNPRHYMDESELSLPKQKWLERSFSNPNANYIVINLNSRGDYKIKDLKKDYARRLEELIEAIREKYPTLNVFVSAPESHFGKEVTEEVQELMSQKRWAILKQVAFLPDDKELWKPILKDAKAVVTQDSGFAHVANIFNENVITLHRNIPVQKDGKRFIVNEGEGHRWSKNGVFVEYSHSRPGTKPRSTNQILGHLGRFLASSSNNAIECLTTVFSTH